MAGRRSGISAPAALEQAIEAAVAQSAASSRCATTATRLEPHGHIAAVRRF